jgi:hypothetical protein
MTRQQLLLTLPLRSRYEAPETDERMSLLHGVI